MVVSVMNSTSVSSAEMASMHFPLPMNRKR